MTTRSLSDARAAFALIGDELVEVGMGTEQAWLLGSDLRALESPPSPSGVRLLPVGDPYLQQRDRATLLEDERARRKLWQPVRGPGGVLVAGEIVGVWRARAAGRRLQVTVEPFSRLARGVREQVEAEAQRVAPFRDCDSASVSSDG